MKIAIIGGGNMGGAIACGLAGGTVVSGGDITVADLSVEALRRIKDIFPQITTTSDSVEAVRGVDMVIVAVKPWLLGEIMALISPVLDFERQSVVSVVAGVNFDQIDEMIAKSVGDKMEQRRPTLFRLIPNTAISIGRSVTFIANNGATEAQTAVMERMFGELGSVFTVSEQMITAGTSLASCGIAFALKYIDASIAGGVELGFSADQSRAIVMQTVRGALDMLATNGTMPQTEIDKVTTPGGITLKGLEAMKEARFVEAVEAGLKSSR